MTYKLLLFFLTFLSFCPIGRSQDETIAARSNALGKVSAIHRDLWAVENNPAALAFVKNIAGGIDYKSPFLLKEMANKAAAFSYPIENGTFGAVFNQFGSRLYNENKIGISYGQILAKNLSLGVQLTYQSTQIKESQDNPKSALSGTVGIFAKAAEDFTLAAVIVNPNRAKRSEYQDERYPSYFKMALAYDFSKKVSLMTEVNKTIEHQAQLGFGLEYKAMDIIHFRAGYASNPSISSFGFGLQLRDFTLDLASTFHNVLGFSPQVSLSYLITKKQ